MVRANNERGQQQHEAMQLQRETMQQQREADEHRREPARASVDKTNLVIRQRTSIPADVAQRQRLALHDGAPAEMQVACGGAIWGGPHVAIAHSRNPL